MILSPLQGLSSFYLLTQGGARFTPLALGYFLSGFQPFQFEPSHAGCCRLKSLSTFAFTTASFLMSGGQGRLKPSPVNFFVAWSSKSTGFGVQRLWCCGSALAQWGARASRPQVSASRRNHFVRGVRLARRQLMRPGTVALPHPQFASGVVAKENLTGKSLGHVRSLRRLAPKQGFPPRPPEDLVRMKHQARLGSSHRRAWTKAVSGSAERAGYFFAAGAFVSLSTLVIAAGTGALVSFNTLVTGAAAGGLVMVRT